jgi:hypothetical protein
VKKEGKGGVKEKLEEFNICVIEVDGKHKGCNRKEHYSYDYPICTSS